MDLLLTHSDAEGTLLDGTSRGDGIAELITPLGWRWSRLAGQWYLPASRERAPHTARINATVTALTAAGRQVQVELDTTHDPAATEQRLTARSAERSDYLAGRAEQHHTQAQHHDTAFHAIADHIPLGQPILAGHHSAPAARRDRERMDAHLQAGVEQDQIAQEYHRRAHAAAATPGARHSPITVANRIKRLEATMRDLERRSVRYTATGHPHALDEQIARTRVDLDYWTAVRQEQIARGDIREFGPATVNVGDLVRISGQWREVVRVNPKSVSVTTGHSWTDRAPWDRVTDHRARPLNQTGESAPDPVPPAGQELP